MVGDGSGCGSVPGPRVQGTWGTPILVQCAGWDPGRPPRFVVSQPFHAETVERMGHPHFVGGSRVGHPA